MEQLFAMLTKIDSKLNSLSERLANVEQKLSQVETYISFYVYASSFRVDYRVNTRE